MLRLAQSTFALLGFSASHTMLNQIFEFRSVKSDEITSMSCIQQIGGLVCTPVEY